MEFIVVVVAVTPLVCEVALVVVSPEVPPVIEVTSLEEPCAEFEEDGPVALSVSEGTTSTQPHPHTRLDETRTVDINARGLEV